MATAVAAAKLTVTEALAEIKTLGARIQKRRESIFPYLARQNAITDPLERDFPGGSPEFIRRERQAAKDLEERLVTLRTAIQRLNQTETITIGAETRTIAGWLTWRKEVMPGLRSFLASIRGGLDKMRKEAQTKQVGVVNVSTNQTPQYNDVLVNINEVALADEVEQLENVVGTLDGQLSLKNATTFIEV